jgi:hypothetical protein
MIPGEFLYYVDTCREAARLRKVYQHREAGLLVDQLWERVFTWTNSRSLGEYAKDEIVGQLDFLKIPATVTLMDELVEETMMIFYLMTDLACSEAAKPPQERDPTSEEDVRCLYPRFAIGRAIDGNIKKRWLSK